MQDEEGEGGVQRTRLRGSAAELSWLLRTKYITNEGAEQVGAWPSGLARPAGRQHVQLPWDRWAGRGGWL